MTDNDWRSREEWEAHTKHNWPGYTYERWLETCAAWDRQREADTRAQRQGKIVRVGPRWDECMLTDLDRLTQAELEALRARVDHELSIRKVYYGEFAELGEAMGDLGEVSTHMLLDWLGDERWSALWHLRDNRKPVDAAAAARWAERLITELERRFLEGEVSLASSLNDVTRLYWPPIAEAASRWPGP